MKKSNNGQVLKGLFLPENPEFELNGTLTITSEDTCWMELIGTFPTHHLYAKRCVFIMFGRLINGNKVTLLNSYRREGSHQKGGSIQNYSAGTVVIGTHITSRDALHFKSITAEINHLQEWIDIDGGEISFTDDFKSFDNKYKEPVRESNQCNEIAKTF